MNDMRSVITPKSDQMNADDLLAGPVTITIRDVGIRPGTEQPVSIHYDGDNGKPWKPCKSMCRVLVAAWGPDAKAYVGRSATLYCDPKVKGGGMEVGGIRISHLSHINRDMMMALTATKGKRAPFVVKPMSAPMATPTKTQHQPDEAEILREARAVASLGMDVLTRHGKEADEATRAILKAHWPELKHIAESSASETGEIGETPDPVTAEQDERED